MSSNIAQHRADKAKRRKAVVEGKRKAEIAASGGRSLAERTLPTPPSDPGAQ